MYEPSSSRPVIDTSIESPTLTLSSPAGISKRLDRKNAVHFAADVHENGFRADRDHRALDRLAVAVSVVLLLEFRQDIGKEFSASAGVAWARVR